MKIALYEQINKTLKYEKTESTNYDKFKCQIT